MSDNVMYLETSRVRPLGIKMGQAMAIVKRIGVGSGQALHGVDLTLPEDAFNPPVEATFF
jgi:lipoate-protein ligase A